nr:IMP dehydrogenase [Treponema sp.]
MAYFFEGQSHTFDEYLLVPGYTSADCIPANVSLQTPVVRYNKKAGEACPLTMNIPMTSAVMQSVSDDRMAVALAKEGGISFIFGSQTIENQAAMVAKVKAYKAGFVTSDTNIRPEQSLQELVDAIERTGHSTVAVTEDGTANGKLLGIITDRDFRISHCAPDAKVKDYMTPLSSLVMAEEGITLEAANDLIWQKKVNQLPVVDKNGKLLSLIFRKDAASHQEHPLELLDSKKRYLVGAGINTRDYMERVPALLKAGVDIMTLDSSEGFTEWQRKALKDIHENFGYNVRVGAGNVVDAEGFRFLAEAGADFVKIGIGGGSICITREQKGIGRGQATATIEVAKARDEYYKETGIYIPICSDGGIVHDHHITLALAMGADFVMLGRYFARFDESPTNKLIVNGNYVKEYWGEGSNRARNWQRYDLG